MGESATGGGSAGLRPEEAPALGGSQERRDLGHRLAAVGDLILSCVVDFSERCVEGRVEKDGVITESVSAPGLCRDPPFACRAEQACLAGGRAGQGGDGDVSGGAAIVRDAFDLMKQETIAPRVVEIGGAVPRRERAGAAA